MKVTMEVARSSGANVTATVTVDYAALIARGLPVAANRNLRFVTRTGDRQWQLAFGQTSGPRVGLSHRGAQQMAALGYSHVDILKFYYPGATLYDAAGKAVTPQKDTTLAGVMTALGQGGSPIPTPSPAPPVIAQGALNASGVNFRTGPSTDYASKGTLSRNTQVGIYASVQNSKGETWYHLVLTATGEEGFVRSDFITITTTVTPSPMPPMTPDPNIVPKMPGDVDGNGVISAQDAAMILRSLVGLYVMNDAQKKAADVNGDGLVSAQDAARILRYLVQLDKELGG